MISIKVVLTAVVLIFVGRQGPDTGTDPGVRLARSCAVLIGSVVLAQI
jgi:hypothetical protein